MRTFTGQYSTSKNSTKPEMYLFRKINRPYTKENGSVVVGVMYISFLFYDNKHYTALKLLQHYIIFYYTFLLR